MAINKDLDKRAKSLQLKPRPNQTNGWGRPTNKQHFDPPMTEVQRMDLELHLHLDSITKVVK